MATRGIPVGPPPGLAVPGPGGAQLPGLRDILPSLIRIETVHSRPSYAQPWQQGRSVASMSSGFAIRGKRILTNAHAVAGAAQVRVRRAGSAKRYAAQVVAIGRDCDLAMLAVPDAEFWAPRPAVQAKQGQTARQFDYIDIFERAPDLLPDLEERISVVGFPAGGESVSITSGIVSRIEMQLYTNGNLRLLAVQVDAAINPGNSGGPVFDGRRRFVGIAFQSLAGYGIQNVGYIIPIPVVKHFLEDLARHGGYTGYPTLGIEMQGLENPALRRFLSLPDSLSGILVTHVSELSCCRPAVQVGDVLTEIDGKSIGDDGTVAFPVELLGSAREGGVQRDERIDMEFLVTEHQVGDSCTLTLFRKGAIVKSEITLTAPDPLIPPEGKRVKRGLEHLKLPSYRLVGGLVLTVLTDALIGAETHLGGTTGTAIASAILAPYFEPPKRFKDEEAVICGGVLAHGSTVGYEGLIMLRLGSVNGEPVRNLKQVSQVIDTAVRNGVKAREEGATEGRYLQLEFERGPIAVLDTWNLPQDTAEVLELHMVPKDRSEDLGDGAGLVGKASKEGWMMGRL